jgi:hypothetical protein
LGKVNSVLSEEGIGSSAVQAGFTQRQSKLSAMMFMKLLFFDHLCMDQPSLSEHSFSLFNDHGKKISKQALHKRFNDSAVAFVKDIFEQYLQYQLRTARLPSTLSNLFTAIRIMDSTVFKLPGTLAAAFPGFGGDGTKACAKVQFEFEMLTGTIKHFSLEHARVSDKTYGSDRQASLCAGELVLRDLGYYSIESYRQIDEQQAWYVSRLKSQISIYEKSRTGYKKLSYRKVIKQLERTGQRYLDKEVYIGHTHKYPVRLIANLLEKPAIARRVARKKHGKKQLTKSDKEMCRLNIVITNLPAEMATAEELYRLYKIRWQIELMFKVFKSVVKLDKVRKMQPARLKCYLYSKLLWILLSRDICRCFERVAWIKHGRMLSLYKCFTLLKQQATVLKDKLFCQGKGLREWLMKMYQVFMDYGLKENRKNRVPLSELLKMEQGICYG